MSTPTLCTGLYIADFNNHPFFPANTTPRTTLKLYSPWRILFNKSPSSYRFILQPHEPLYKTHRFYSYFAPSFSFFPILLLRSLFFIFCQCACLLLSSQFLLLVVIKAIILPPHFLSLSSSLTPIKTACS